MTLMFLLPLCLFTVAALAKDQKPAAADLVEDGQLIDLTSPRYQELFQELQNDHKFLEEELTKIFTGITIRRRVLELMDKQWEARPWHEYYPRFITAKAISEGRKNLARYEKVLDRVEQEIGVEREIIVAIWGIESRYGQSKGSFNMLQTLNTMFDAYPRRSKFYRGQLIDFLLLCRENGIDPQQVSGSYGGAFGQTQFIPSSFREYAVDFDQDGKRDVWASVPDVLASIANYLHSYNWTAGMPTTIDLGPALKGENLEKAYQKGRKGLLDWQEVAETQGIDLPQPVADQKLTIVGLEQEDGSTRYLAGYPNFQAITKWNNSNRYAMAVTELAARLKK
ncbi:MAG: lytic murein transglycosylase [Proteobacteria bacterium]|nr:lytic murein transglycosylase [Pseudomonadota bacterium]MBU1689037.1 lytic murein transglycosylase [Pseudomonadota bacterium]